MHKHDHQTVSAQATSRKTDFNILTSLTRQQFGTQEDSQNRGDHNTARDTQRHYQRGQRRTSCSGIVTGHKMEHSGIQGATRNQRDHAGHHVNGHGHLGQPRADLRKARANQRPQQIREQFPTQKMPDQEVNGRGQQAAQGRQGQASGMNVEENGKAQGLAKFQIILEERSINFLLVGKTCTIQLPYTRPILAIVPVLNALNATLTNK